jgi:hypothetical protein
VIAYIDTSALVKLLVSDEDGAETASEIWDAADVAFTSRIAYPEARAALAAAARAGRLTRGALGDARDALADLFAQCAVVELGAAIAEAAGDASERFALRAYDAVHLASVFAVAEGTTVLLTWDEQLSAAGRLAGLDVVP